MGQDVVCCAYCREPLGEGAVKYRGSQYCSPACAFEASRKPGSICDSPHSSLERDLRLGKGLEKGSPASQ